MANKNPTSKDNLRKIVVKLLVKIFLGQGSIFNAPLEAPKGFMYQFAL